MPSGQRSRFLSCDLVDVLAPVFPTSVTCEASEQRLVMNLDPIRGHSLIGGNVDAGDLDIPLVQKNDISLSDVVRRENNGAIVLRRGVDDLRVSDQYGLERLIESKRRYKIGLQGNSL